VKVEFKKENEKAISAVSNGNFSVAEKIYGDLYRTTRDSAFAEKLADINYLKVTFLNAVERFADSYRVVTDAVFASPDNPVFQVLLLDLIHKRQRYVSEIGRNRNKRGRLILGSGSGRSGSASLTSLLHAQPESYFSHEHPPRLSWTDAGQRLEFHLKRFDLMLSLFDVVGDVSHWWLPHFEIVQKTFPDVKMIVTRRDLASTASSFLKLKGGERKGSINHWVRHDGSYWASNAWDECYPKYQAQSLEEALILYWKDFYGQAENLQHKFPNAVKIVPIESLSTADGQARIFEFLEMEKSTNSQNVFLNKGSGKDGERMWPNVFSV
jgi:hypothetical protein